MNTATINFSDGSKLTIKENDLLIPIFKVKNNNMIKDLQFETFASEGQPFEIWYHASFALTPSILELIFNCEYFRVLDSLTVYNSNSVVSVVNN